MNEYQKKDMENVEKLTKELAQFVEKAYTEYSENGECFYSVLVRNGKEYTARRDYNGYILIYEKEYKRYKHVSMHTIGEITRKYSANKMKVPTAKKINARMDAIDAIISECDALELAHSEKIAAFLATVAPYKPEYDYHHEYRDTANGKTERVNTDIAGGEIVKNGLVFTFHIEQDGYISKKISVHYSVDNTLEQFEKMTA